MFELEVINVDWDFKWDIISWGGLWKELELMGGVLALHVIGSTPEEELC